MQALALNENEPEDFIDLLEPNYHELKNFQQIFDDFKDLFFDGHNIDPECDDTVKPKTRVTYKRKLNEI